jgi:hypothetical protein
MPIRYSVDRLHGRLLTHAEGLVTFDEINAHLDVEQRDGNLDRPELFDARGATTDLTADQIRRLVRRAASMRRAGDVGPTAIVTNSDVVFGMGRMYSLLADGAGVAAEVFRDLESATRWLDQMARSLSESTS